MDIVGSLVGLVVCAPIMLAAAVAVKLTSGGPIIFRQWRAGFAGRPFMICKFRSMYLGAEKLQEQLQPLNEADGPVFKMRKDPRVTPVGRVLRKWSIDELPQLWNVLRGEMSLVGPRPLPYEQLPCGAGMCHTSGHACRLSVHPGITCYWQVRGRSSLDFKEWFEMDMIYLDDRSLLVDLKILLMTFVAVLSTRGAH